MQMDNGLMRYHSAPSSVLTSLVLDEDCSQQARVSDAFCHREESEFARFFDDYFCNMVDPHSGSMSFSSPDFLPEPASTSATKAGACLADSEMQPQLHTEHHASLQQLIPCRAWATVPGCGSSIKEIFGYRSPLSPISDQFLADESKQAYVLDDAEIMKIRNASHSPKPLTTPAVPHEGELANVKGRLARHNSSPADVLSRLVMEELGNSGEPVLHFGNPPLATQESESGNHVCATFASPAEQRSTFDQVSCLSNTKLGGKGMFVAEAMSVKSPADAESQSTLLRQSSSPADVLSSISFGGVPSVTCREMASTPFSMNYATEEGRRGRAYQPARCWGDIGCENAGLEDRKRARDEHSSHGPQSSEISFTNQTYPHVGSHAKMPGSKDFFKMEVLCRVSAKRGCATHPRSIAERVRRTKINEGIRKLQELMPNMEKQTSTVEMLDEAVEYVKYLEQQVQELSKNRSKCDGRCKTNA